MKFTWQVVAVAILAASESVSGQAAVPTIALGAPRFTTGDLELHRVAGAGLLPDGRIAIANSGTTSVFIVNQRGTVEKRFGLKGTGPGAFDGLTDLATFGDTIVTVDGPGARMTLWRPDGTVIRTSFPQGATGQGVVGLEAIASPSAYLTTRRSYGEQPANGLYLKRFTLLAVDGEKKTELGEHPWAYSYFYADKVGKTSTTASYATPFLGTSLAAAAAGKTLMLGLGDTVVTLIRADGTRGKVSLPIKPITGRERAKAYGDSMIAAQKDPHPDWVRKFRSMFGPDFPVAERQAVAQRAVTVGGTVWFQEFQQPGASQTTWWIVDARREALVGRVSLPGSARVLGGTDQQVLVRLADSDGVQSVALYDVRRR